MSTVQKAENMHADVKNEEVATNEPNKVKQREIEKILWEACDTFRGAVDPSEYKNYILVFLFLKYISDVCAEKRREYAEKYGEGSQRAIEKMKLERFILPDETSFNGLYENRADGRTDFKIHTNTVEGFWSLVKKTINGTHYWVSQKHLQKYLNEMIFRYVM